MTVINLSLEPVLHLTDEQFYQLCRVNREVRFERTVEGQLMIMPPTGWETGNRNGRLTQRLFNWADQDGTGLAFDSSTGFRLPNGADRSPDAAWVKQDRLAVLNPDPDKFLALAPDFVVEIRSSSDALKPLQQKMQEYRDNGVQLGWLINPKDQQVEIYRPSQIVEVLQSPLSLSGEEVLPGFLLHLQGILT